MSFVLTKETLIDSKVRKVGTVIDDIATPGEIESLLRTQRAKRTSESKPKDAPSAEKRMEPFPDEALPTDIEPGTIVETPEGEQGEVADEDIAHYIDAIGLPANVAKALRKDGIKTVFNLVERISREGYELSSIKGIGAKSEAIIRDSFVE